MYSRIMVAVDGSDISALALQEALALARDQHAQVRIVHVIDTVPPLDVAFDAFRQSCLQEGREVLDHAVGVARQAEVEAEPLLVDTESSPSRGITDEAARWPADLIVVGTHGRTGLMHLLLGSVAEGVVRHAPVPVLLVRSVRTAPDKPPG